MTIIGLAKPWKWVQPRTDKELLQRLAEARDYRVPERERENLCSVAHDRLKVLLTTTAQESGSDDAGVNPTPASVVEKIV